MSDLDHPKSELLCPFEEVLDRRVLGEATDEDRRRLDEHLAQGCPSCGPRFQAESALEELVQGAMAPLEAEAEARRRPVLERLGERLSREDDRRRDRRRRRTGLNALLFLTIFLGIGLLGAAYLVSTALARRIVAAQTDAARAEIRGLLAVLERYARDHGGELPRDAASLVHDLAEPRPGSGRPYFVPHASRVDGEGRLLDPWGKRLVYRRFLDGAIVYSTGANGRDEQNSGDDVGWQLLLPR